MIEHLSNCHGELNMLMGIMSTIPLLGMWFSAEFWNPTCDTEVSDESR